VVVGFGPPLEQVTCNEGNSALLWVLQERQDKHADREVLKNKKWLKLKLLTSNTISTTFYVNVSTLTYLTDPLKTPTFALFWPQIPPKATKIR
jgi:hypothetical protein